MANSETQLIEVALPRYVLSYFLDECLEERDFWKANPRYHNNTDVPTPNLIAMWSAAYDAIQKALT